MRDSLRGRYALLTVIALMILYSVYFSAYSIQRNATFRTHASDLGQMDQALWNTLQGRFLEDTKPDGRQATRMTDHVEPIFALVSLSYLFYDGVEAILVFQSIAIALASLPIYWIARRKLESDWAGVAFAAMYLLFPAVEAANLAEFHAVTLAPAPLMLAYNYGEERAWERYVLFSLIALMVKEEIALLVFAMALYFAFRVRSEKRKTSSFLLLALGLLALIWFYVAVFVIVAQTNLTGKSPYIDRYPGASTSLLKSLGAIPQLVSSIFIPDKITYLLQLLASVGFLALLDPISLLVGSPSIVLNLLSSYPAQYSGTYHYSAPVVPYFILAAIGGTRVVRDWVTRRFATLPVRRGGKVRAQEMVIAPAFLIAVGYQLIAGYTPLGGEFFWPQTTQHQQLLARFANQIPRDAKVSATSSLFPHISHREFLYRFPLLQDAEYVLLDVSQASTTNPIDFRVNYLNTLKQGFGVRDAADGYILLERGIAQTELPDPFYDFVRTRAEPQNRVVVDFEDKVRFLGFDVRQDDWERVYLRTYWTRLPTMEDNNFALYPFFADANGAPRADAQLPPLLVHFWYPTARWRVGQVIVADTLPIEVGPRAKIAVGVFFGATWEDSDRRLMPKTTAPASTDHAWAVVAEIARIGKGYQVVK